MPGGGALTVCCDGGGKMLPPGTLTGTDLAPMSFGGVFGGGGGVTSDSGTNVGFGGGGTLTGG